MKPPFVAIADDDAAFANYLKTFLDGRGYQSRVYSHGEDLLSAARVGDLPDVVLLDVMMPGLDGLATLRSLKGAHPDLQVIMLSGREHASTIVEASPCLRTPMMSPSSRHSMSEQPPLKRREDAPAGARGRASRR